MAALPEVSQRHISEKTNGSSCHSKINIYNTTGYKKTRVTWRVQQIFRVLSSQVSKMAFQLSPAPQLISHFMWHPPMIFSSSGFQGLNTETQWIQKYLSQEEQAQLLGLKHSMKSSAANAECDLGRCLTSEELHRWQNCLCGLHMTDALMRKVTQRGKKVWKNLDIWYFAMLGCQNCRVQVVCEKLEDLKLKFDGSDRHQIVPRCFLRCLQQRIASATPCDFYFGQSCTGEMQREKVRTRCIFEQSKVRSKMWFFCGFWLASCYQ